MKKLFYFFAVMTLTTTFVACEKMDIEQPVENPNNIKGTGTEIIIENFAKALANVLYENKECRELIKTEALRKINYDYDVLYMLVKDKKLNDGTTLENLMLTYLDSKDMDFMMESFPTLTIFVPSLPENSFSCDSWNVQTEFPDVAVRPNNSLLTYCYDAKGNEYVLEPDEIPGFPIVVLKINERIILKKERDSHSSILRSTTNPNIEFEFTDPVFDNTMPRPETRRDDYNNNVKIQKALEAYNIFPNNLIGWQRDYVYYNLTNSNDRGRLDVRFRESIVGFKFLGNPSTLIDNITRFRDDPKLINKNDWFDMRKISIPGTSRSMLTPWTDGEFEFQVKYSVLSKNTPSSETNTSFRLDPTKLFNINVISKTKGILWKKRTVYKITDIQNLFCFIEVPMFDYDLSKYSITYKISIFEKDDPQTTSQTVQTSTEFASNFSFDPGIGEIIKTGTKYGSSEKQTKTVTSTTSVTTGSDDLGTVTVNFEDEIIRSNNFKFENIQGRNSYPIPDFNNAYRTGHYQIYVCPILLN